MGLELGVGALVLRGCWRIGGGGSVGKWDMNDLCGIRGLVGRGGVLLRMWGMELGYEVDRILLCDERLDRRGAIGGETETREYGRHHEEDRGTAGNVQEYGLCRVWPDVEESIEIRY